MKTINHAVVGAVALLASAFTAHAITNTAIAVSGTNIVLSWPSYGYEIYLVQYCPTVNPGDSWMCLTNAYPANVNQTTFTVYGVVPPPGGGNNASYDAMNTAGNYDSTAATMGPLVFPADGSGSPVPLMLYPPGFDLSGFTILDPATGETVNGSGYTVNAQALPMDDFPQMPAPSGGGSGAPTPPPTTGFFEVFHIPNFLASFSGYTFDGPTFIPVDYSDPDADVNCVDDTAVLIGGQPTDYAVFMPYVVNGVTNWGVGIYFDRLPNGTNTIQLITTVRQSDTLNDQTPYMVFSNAPAAITIGNLITYTNWDDLIWNNTNCTMTAQCSVSNVNLGNRHLRCERQFCELSDRLF